MQVTDLLTPRSSKSSSALDCSRTNLTDALGNPPSYQSATNNTTSPSTSSFLSSPLSPGVASSPVATGIETVDEEETTAAAASASAAADEEAGDGGSIYSHSQDETASIDRPLTAAGALDGPEFPEVNVVFIKYPDDCCPKCFEGKCPCCDWLAATGIGQRFWQFRCCAYSLVENKYFETFIIVMIIASSLALVSSSASTLCQHEYIYFLKHSDLKKARTFTA